MKYILLILLVGFFGNLPAQDWSIRTTNRTRWTAAGFDGEDTILTMKDTSYIQKKGSNIIFTFKNHKKVVPFLETKNFPASDEKAPFDDRDGFCTVYYTRMMGMIIYFPKLKKVMRYWPMVSKYVYF
jgi:hypothetical protein